MTKRFILLATLFATTLSLSAQRNMQVWEGNTYSEFLTNSIDSVTFLLCPEGILRECETKHDTVLITKTDTVEKVITKHDTITVIQKDTVYINTCKDDNKRIGVFSVSADREVSFSPGNLQYQASTNTWRFAEHQYDYIGVDNQSISETYIHWIDLFGFGTNDNPTQSSTDDKDYLTFGDWGTNAIGNDVPYTWRTLTYDEWAYLFMHTRWTIAWVKGTLGLMLLPDDFTVPDGMTISILGDGNISGLSQKKFNESHYASNRYTVTKFAQLEAAGAVFLPCAGFRAKSDGYTVGLDVGVYDAGSNGYYWSADLYEGVCAGGVFEFSTNACGLSAWPPSVGLSVRLVQDIE